jgi:DNA-binding MarR family transcriptional regulator
MEEAGWIQRKRMEHDQRRVKVTVTPATKKLGRSMAPMIEREYMKLEKLVGVKQLQQVYDALDTLQKNLGASTSNDDAR